MIDFKAYCEVLQRVADSRGTVEKTRIFADWLAMLGNERDIELSVQFAGEGAFSSISGKRASVGGRTIGESACAHCQIDYEKVFRPCRTALGSTSETIQRLCENLDHVRQKTAPKSFSLPEIYAFFEQLETTRKREEKQVRLLEIWKLLTPLEIKYFLRILSQGSLRIGFELRSILNAVAEAFGQEIEEVRYAHLLTGSLGKTAVLAFKKELDQATFKIFQPLAFMLASPIESRKVEDFSTYLAEEKFDGMRCQIHFRNKEVKIFSRDLNEVTNSFPDLVSELIQWPDGEVVLDGEIVVFKDERIFPFQHLQKRMGVKKPSKKLLQTHPVKLIAYDLLYKDGEAAFKLPLKKRRSLLNSFAQKTNLAIARQFQLGDAQHVEQLFDQALANGNEGLVLKQVDSPYEYGQRKSSWLKVKKPAGSLDVAIMYAHAGSGKRGGTYSDFTLGIRVADDPRYEEEFIPIGKAYGGYSNDELKKLNQAIKPLVVDRFGPTLSLRPEIVVEIEFDEIQINRRTKAGHTLRLPRFRAIRWDLRPSDCDSLQHVEQLFEAQGNRKASPQGEGKSFICPKN